ncbi:hypothetical protein ABVT39_000126, partial [Epinephelus coioides]
MTEPLRRFLTAATKTERKMEGEGCVFVYLQKGRVIAAEEDHNAFRDYLASASSFMFLQDLNQVTQCVLRWKMNNNKHLLEFDSSEGKNSSFLLLMLLRCVTNDSGYYIAIK